MDKLIFRSKLITEEISKLKTEFNRNSEYIRLLQENNNALMGQIDNRIGDLQTNEEEIFNYYER